MAWLKADDKLHDHRKVLKLLRSGDGAHPDPAPVGLWVLAGTWAADNRTDGWIPSYLLHRWSSDADAHAALLVAVGLWEPASSDGEAGYQFHDFLKYNPSREELEKREAYNRRKARMHRDPKLLAEVRKRDKDRCRYCGAGVRFADHTSGSGGTYDHIDPRVDSPNTLDNLVVACKSCNSSKGGRTLEEWGQKLLPPGSMGKSRKRVTRKPATKAEAVPGTDSVAVPGTDSVDVPGTDSVAEGSPPGRDGSGPGYVLGTDEESTE